MLLGKLIDAGASSVWFLVNEVIIDEELFPSEVLPKRNTFDVLRQGREVELGFVDEKNSKRTECSTQWSR